MKTYGSIDGRNIVRSAQNSFGSIGRSASSRQRSLRSLRRRFRLQGAGFASCSCSRAEPRASTASAPASGVWSGARIVASGSVTGATCGWEGRMGAGLRSTARGCSPAAQAARASSPAPTTSRISRRICRLPSRAGIGPTMPRAWTRGQVTAALRARDSIRMRSRPPQSPLLLQARRREAQKKKLVDAAAECLDKTTAAQFKKQKISPSMVTRRGMTTYEEHR